MLNHHHILSPLAYAQPLKPWLIFAYSETNGLRFSNNKTEIIVGSLQISLEKIKLNNLCTLYLVGAQ